MQKKHSTLFGAILVVLLFLSGNARAQSRITGLVTDDCGNPRSHCTVRAMQDGRIIATGVTDGAGIYTLNNLTEGAYTLTYSYGNTKAVVNDVRISMNESTTMDPIVIAEKKRTTKHDIALQEIARRPLINWQYPTCRTLYADDLAHMPGY